MRIVDVCAFYSPHGGGVKTYIDRKLKAGPAMGHEIIVIAPGSSNRVEERGPGGRILFLKQPKFPLDTKYHYFDDDAALHGMLDELQPDVVEASSPWRSARYVAEWAGTAPRFLVMHADPLSAYAYRWLGKMVKRETIDNYFVGGFWDHLLSLDAAFDGTITASESLTNRLVEGGLKKVITNPMGVEGGIFTPTLRDEGLRARMLERCALGPDATLLLGVGRHAPEKRWPMVIEAVTAAGLDAPIGFILVGDGRERKRVVRAAKANPHIHFASPVSGRIELARLLASGDALIHGCEAETFCMVAAEARASGLPLIAPNEGGAGDQARASGGWIYDWGEPAAAAAAIRDFVDADPVTVRANAIEAAAHVRLMDDHFAELFALYQSRVDSNPRRR